MFLSARCRTTLADLETVVRKSGGPYLLGADLTYVDLIWRAARASPARTLHCALSRSRLAAAARAPPAPPRSTLLPLRSSVRPSGERSPSPCPAQPAAAAGGDTCVACVTTGGCLSALRPSAQVGPPGPVPRPRSEPPPTVPHPRCLLREGRSAAEGASEVQRAGSRRADCCVVAGGRGAAEGRKDRI